MAFDQDPAGTVFFFLYKRSYIVEMQCFSCMSCIRATSQRVKPSQSHMQAPNTTNDTT